MLLSASTLRFRLKYVGRSFVPMSVKLIGARRIHIGMNTAIGARSWLNVNNFSGVEPALVICDNCFIGLENFFTVGKRIVIREYCLTTKSCSFIGSSHLYGNPMMPHIATGTTDHSTIYIGVNCFVGYHACIMGNVNIGHGCIIGANAIVHTDIPPFSLATGDPAKVVKRFDFAVYKWVNWPSECYTDGPSEEEYLQYLRARFGYHMLPFSAAGTFRDLP